MTVTLTRFALPALLIPLALAGCGKVQEAASEKAAEKMIEATINKDGSNAIDASGVLPDGAPVALRRSPVINYTYARTRPILDRLKHAGDIGRHHGARVRYANPTTGGWALPTMGAHLALLPSGFKGEPYRSTDGTVFVCVEGKGQTKVGDTVTEERRLAAAPGSVAGSGGGDAASVRARPKMPSCLRYHGVRYTTTVVPDGSPCAGRPSQLHSSIRFWIRPHDSRHRESPPSTGLCAAGYPRRGVGRSCRRAACLGEDARVLGRARPGADAAGG